MMIDNIIIKLEQKKKKKKKKSKIDNSITRYTLTFVIVFRSFVIISVFDVVQHKWW